MFTKAQTKNIRTIARDELDQRLDPAITKNLDNRFRNVATKQDIYEIREDLGYLAELVHGIIDSMDVLNTRTSRLEEEYAAMCFQLDRHDKHFDAIDRRFDRHDDYFHLIADKLGVALPA